MATVLRSCAVAALVLVARATMVARAAQRLRAPQHGKLFYLFLANDHIGHADLWGQFFSYAKSGVDYEALLHCQDEAQCRQAMQGSIFQPTLIPSVFSKYCIDLVNPMIALLESALRFPESTHPELDKFVFVSDSALPVKPFWTIHTVFTREPSSRFCLMNHKAPPYNMQSDGSVLVKASQWSTVSRKHSQLLVDTRANFDKFKEDWYSELRTMHATHCMDELYVFWGIFGFFNSTHCSSDEWYLTECADAIEHDFDDLTLACDTYFHWKENVTLPPDVAGLPTTADFLTASDSHEYDGIFGPGYVTDFSAMSLQAWRRSPYAFVRKVEEDASFIAAEGGEVGLADAFTKHVFEEA